MPIYEGSRNQTGRVLRVKAADGVVRPTIFQDPHWLENDFDFVYYTFKENDRLDKLAYRLYGTSEYWWAIARVNPELLYCDNIPVGTVIRIPK